MKSILSVPARLRVLELKPGDFDDDCTRRANRRRKLADLQRAVWLLRWALLLLVGLNFAAAFGLLWLLL